MSEGSSDSASTCLALKIVSCETTGSRDTQGNAFNNLTLKSAKITRTLPKTIGPMVGFTPSWDNVTAKRCHKEVGTSL